MIAAKVKQILIPTAMAFLTLTACAPQKAKLQDAADLFFDAHKIIGGEKLSAVSTLATHTVALYDYVEGSLCTGTILSDDIILTAGHCIPSESTNLVVLFGPDAQKYTAYRRVRFAGANSQFHPRQESAGWADIALVYFVGGLPDGYTPAELLDRDDLLQKGTITELAGYGIDDGVKKTGSGFLRHTKVSIDNPQFAFGEVTLNQTKGSGACHGDSGGPAYIEVDSKLKVWGVTSRTEGDKLDNCQALSIYTNALDYNYWITEATKAIHEAAQAEKEAAAKQDPKTTPKENKAPLKLAQNINLFL